jgi:hypothetical protein
MKTLRNEVNNALKLCKMSYILHFYLKKIEKGLCYEMQGKLRRPIFFGAFATGKWLCHSHVRPSVRPSVRIYTVDTHRTVFHEIYLLIAILIKTGKNSRHFYMQMLVRDVIFRLAPSSWLSVLCEWRTRA